MTDGAEKRASKSHQELFEICPLEQAHLLSQQDTEALAEGSDIKVCTVVLLAAVFSSQQTILLINL